MEPEEGFLEVNGLRLHYLRWPGEGPPVVLHHATGFLARIWEPIALRLASRYQVLAYDARGHGDSDKPPTGYEWTWLVEDLRGFLQSLGLEGVAVVGHSSGGAAALACAALYPPLIACVVALEPVITPPNVQEDGQSNPLAEMARRRRQVWPHREEMLAAYRRRPTFARWREDVLRLYVEHGTRPRGDGQVELKMPGHLEALVYEGRPALNTWDLLPRVRCPVLVVRGGEHASPLYRAAEAACARLPNARLVTVAQGSHFFPMEMPEETAALIEDFLSQAYPWPPS